MAELIRFECPQCRKSLSAKPQHAGRSTKCPGCECLVKVPSAAEETEDFFEFLEADEPEATPPKRNLRDELYQQLTQATDSGATDQALTIIAQLKVEAASDEFNDLWTLERELKRVAAESSASNLDEGNSRPMPREMAFTSPTPSFEIPHPAIPAPGPQPVVGAMPVQTPWLIPPIAYPSPRPQLPVPLPHLAIPEDYTPDGFRALSSRFRWLVIFPFLGPLGLGLFLRLVTFLVGLNDVTAVILIVIYFVGLVLAALSGITAIVVHFILLYRFWRLIQDGKARTTPAKALWFFAIPIFNFYWWYVAYVGLAEDMNRYCVERNIPAPRIHEGQAVALYVMALWGLIPFVNLITSIAALFLLLRQVKQWTDVAVAILEARLNRVAV